MGVHAWWEEASPLILSHTVEYGEDGASTSHKHIGISIHSVETGLDALYRMPNIFDIQVSTAEDDQDGVLSRLRSFLVDAAATEGRKVMADTDVSAKLLERRGA
jgi:hypothetical protein